MLDSIIKIPKYSRLNEELKLKLLNSLDHLSYADDCKDNLPLGFAISQVSIYNIIDKSSIEVKYTPFKKTSKRIHIQIDEKYVSMKSKRHKSSKKRIYTATIFTGINKAKKNRYFLENRVIISARSLN